MKKKLIFISHISSEKEIALAFKALVQQAFLGIIEVFVSSDPESIAMGGRWLDDITEGLVNCEVEIVFASPESITRPWINFEAGAGWIRKIPVIPICHSGLTPSNLSPPLSQLQSATATKSSELDNVFKRLAKTLECNTPTVDFSTFINIVKTFENTSRQIEQAERKSLTPEVSGLRDYELATLVACGNLMDAPGDRVWTKNVKERMEESFFSPLAATLGLAGLQRKGMIEVVSEEIDSWNSALKCSITAVGWEFLHDNTDALELRYMPGPPSRSRRGYAIDGAPKPGEEEIPF